MPRLTDKNGPPSTSKNHCTKCAPGQLFVYLKIDSRPEVARNAYGKKAGKGTHRRQGLAASGHPWRNRDRRAYPILGHFGPETLQENTRNRLPEKLLAMMQQRAAEPTANAPEVGATRATILRPQGKRGTTGVYRSAGGRDATNYRG